MNDSNNTITVIWTRILYSYIGSYKSDWNVYSRISLLFLFLICRGIRNRVQSATIQWTHGPYCFTHRGTSTLFYLANWLIPTSHGDFSAQPHLRRSSDSTSGCRFTLCLSTKLQPSRSAQTCECSKLVVSLARLRVWLARLVNWSELYRKRRIFPGDFIFVGSIQPGKLNPGKFEHNEYR